MPNPRENQARPTLGDVARLAGVSPATASRTFSRPGRVSLAAAERVRHAAAQLGYNHDAIRRQLRSDARRTGMVAVVMADASPAAIQLLRAARREARTRAFLMVQVDTDSAQDERSVIDRLLPSVDGFVLVGPQMSETAVRTIAKQKPTVVINRVVRGVASVVSDLARGTRRAVEHLATEGRTEILYVAGPEGSWADGMRWRTVQEAGHELGVSVRRAGPFEPQLEGGVSAADAWRERPTPAVITHNDLQALGLIGALARDGVRVPEDLAVVGHENILVGEYTRPSLSSVSAPNDVIGRMAMSNLLAIIGGATRRTDDPIVIPMTLAVRESSRRATD